MIKSTLTLIIFLIFIEIRGQTLGNTNWYLTKIEENNQIENVPLSTNGLYPGNWLLYISIPASENQDTMLTSNYCSGFLGPIVESSTDFYFKTGQVALTLNLPCDWMTTVEIQYFTKYYNFFENYRSNTFTYLIQNNELVITNNAGNKAYYSNVPLSNKPFDKTDKLLSIYPNPAINELSIKLPESEQINSVKIFNIEGREVKKTHSKNVNISDLNAGIYYLEIEIGGVIYTRKFMKK